MQNQTVQQIKISYRDKGRIHWEIYLKNKMRRRINKLLFELEIPPFKKRAILALFNNKITTENVIPISNHNTVTVLQHLIKNQLETLIKNTKITKL